MLYFSSVAHFDFGGLDLFCLSFSVLSLCSAGMFLHEMCSIMEGVAYLVPGMSYTDMTKAFPPQLLSTCSYINQRV